jgi:hypothetical protein
MHTLTHDVVTDASCTLPRSVSGDPALARRCQRVERITFAALVLAMLAFAASSAQPGNALVHALPIPTHEMPSPGQFGWPI